MPKASKIYLKQWDYIGVHTAKPIAETEWNNPTHGPIVGFNTKNGEIEPVAKIGREHMYALLASHEITLPSETWQWNFREAGPRNHQRYKMIDGQYESIVKTTIDGVDFANPHQDVGLIIWGRCKCLGRAPGAAFLYHDDNLYHILTWRDVIGKNSKMSRMSKSRNKRMVIFAQIRTDEEAETMIKLYQEEKPNQGSRY